MGISQAGRGRSSAMGQAEFASTKEVRQKALFFSTGAVVTKAVNAAHAAISQRSAASQTVTSRIKLALLSSSAFFLPNSAGPHIRDGQARIRNLLASAKSLGAENNHPLQHSKSAANSSAQLVSAKATASVSKPHIKSPAEINVMKKYLAAQAAQCLPEKVKNFTEVWKNRHDKPEVCARFLEYAELDNPELPFFLKALDDLRTSPTLEKAEQMFYDFVMPSQVDENNIPIEGAGKWEVNFQSKEVRNERIAAISECIKKVRSESGGNENLQDMVNSFAVSERYFVTQLARNCKFQDDVNKLMP